MNVDVSVLADAIGRTLQKEAMRLRLKGKRLALVLEDIEVLSACFGSLHTTGNHSPSIRATFFCIDLRLRCARTQTMGRKKF